MKPTMQSNESGKGGEPRRFPVTDFHYHSVALEEFNSCCAGKEPAFHTLSRDYFKTEDREYFLAEAIVFAVVMATAALPLLNSIQAMFHLVSRAGGI
jgi:hypothetical protein